MSEFSFKELSLADQLQYKEVAEQLFGKTFVYCETGEPLYMDKDGNMMRVSGLVMDRMEMLTNN